MNRIITATALSLAIATPSFAQTVPLPVPRPAFQNAAYVQHFEFNKVMPNGHVRHCRVSQHLEQARGFVRTQTCWRAR